MYNSVKRGVNFVKEHYKENIYKKYIQGGHEMGESNIGLI